MKNGYTASMPKNKIKTTALDMLNDTVGAVGGLVRAYVSKEEVKDDWLESWFLKRTQLHCVSVFPQDELIVPIELDSTHTQPLSQQSGLHLISIRPHYFRGFKALSDPIDLAGNLVVIEGKNSSGKTR